MSTGVDGAGRRLRRWWYRIRVEHKRCGSISASTVTIRKAAVPIGGRRRPSMACFVDRSRMTRYMAVDHGQHRHISSMTNNDCCGQHDIAKNCHADFTVLSVIDRPTTCIVFCGCTFFRNYVALYHIVRNGDGDDVTVAAYAIDYPRSTVRTVRRSGWLSYRPGAVA